MLSPFARNLWDKLNSQTDGRKRTNVKKLVSTLGSKYFTHAQSYNYIGELQKFAGSYNKTYHTTTGMPPNKVTKGKETNLWVENVLA
jgi:hypothetical protein